MSLIPIPQEVIENYRPVKAKEKIRVIRKQMEKKEDSKANGHLQKTCIKLSKFISSNGNMAPEDISRLINDMHRATLALQKQQHKLRRSTKKKKNRV